MSSLRLVRFELRCRDRARGRMRAAAVLCSLVANAIQLVAFALPVRFRARTPAPLAVTVPVAVASQPPIQVEVIDLRPMTKHAGTESSIAVASTRAAHVEAAPFVCGVEPATAPAPATPPRPHSLYFHMRPPGGLAFSDAQIDDMFAHPLAPPASPPHSGRIVTQPGDRGAVYDEVTTMQIDRDGTAHFRDKPDADIHVVLPVPSLAGIKQMLRTSEHSLADWLHDPYATRRARPSTELTEFQRAVPGECDQWGGLGCEDATPATSLDAPPAVIAVPLPIIVVFGKLDVTSYLMRKTVGDPYSSRKLALLDATRDERAAHGAEQRRAQLTRSAEEMHENLERLWAATLDPDERRSSLFELWDECTEGDGAEGEAGQRARAMVIGWIRGHGITYAERDLATLNARRTSHEPFAP